MGLDIKDDHASPRTADVTAVFKTAVVTEVSQFIPFTLERTSKYDGALHNDFDGVGVVGGEGLKKAGVGEWEQLVRISRL